MASESLEQKFAKLEETVEGLKHEIDRLHAVNEIHNLVCKNQYLHTAGQDTGATDFYAKKVPDVKIYWGEQGYWAGPDAVRKTRAIYSRLGQGPHVGQMAIHPVTTPCIEVAGDGKTAKGVFIGTGFVAGKNRETGEPQCNWEWDKYGIDFIKEDGKWKFWHFHIYRIFHGCGWDEKWVEQFDKPDPQLNIPDDLKPDGPAVDDCPYRPDTVQIYAPVPPEPYETWDDVISY